MNARKQYIRPMEGWWLKHPFYRKYMVREATSIFVGIYAVILLEGLMGLASGEAAFNAWLQAMQNPAAVIFHFIALAAALYHTVTWFKVAPKVMPVIIIGKQKVTEKTITTAHYVAAVILYSILLWMVLSI